MHTVKISIERLPARSGRTYRATLRQDRSIAFGRLRHRTGIFSASDIAALQRSYREQLDLLHELARHGLSAPPPDMRQLLDLGQNIADLLPRAVRQALIAAIQRAHRRHDRLRIILEVAVNAIDLLAVPWELIVLPFSDDGLADGISEGFLLLDSAVALIRQVRGIGTYGTPILMQPLSLQVFAATPADGPPIGLEVTRTALMRALTTAQTADYWHQRSGTIEVLQERLPKTRPQIVHLLCHGEQQDTGNGIRSALLFTRQDGSAQRVGASDLWPTLTLAPGLQLVVLQACDTGAISWPTERASGEERRSLESIALALVSRGVPAVIAMQGQVGQAAAATFMQACYSELARGHSVEQAVAAGRIAIWNAGGHVDWSLPVIYQGSVRPEPMLWSLRLEHHFRAVLQDARMRRAICGGVTSLALVSIAVKGLGWTLAPTAALAPDDLVLPLAAWASTGVTGPAIVAATWHNTASRGRLPTHVRGAVLRAGWMGAYLGYVISGVLILQLFASLWMIGLLALLSQPGVVGLFSSMLLGSLCMSFVGARSQARSALTSASVAPELFDSCTLRLVLIASCICLATPCGTLALLRLPLDVLHDPVLGAVIIALMLLVMAFRFRE